MHFRSPLISPRRRVRTAAAAVSGLAVLSAAALVPAAAQAGQYRVFQCQQPSKRQVPAADWKAERSGVTPRAVDVCDTQGYLYDQLGTDNLTGGAWTGFGLTVPDGLKVTELRADRWTALVQGSAEQVADPSYTTPYYALRWSNTKPGNLHQAPKLVEQCVYSAGCAGMAWPGVSTGTSKVAYDFANGASFIGFELGCQSEWGPARSCAPGIRGYLRINSIDMVVVDDTAPVVSSPSGTLMQSGDKRGVESLTLAASDVGGGIMQGIVYADGKELARIKPDTSPSCTDAGELTLDDQEFTRVQPCSRSIGMSFDVDTRGLSEGKHRIGAIARDAGGNLSNGFTTDIIVDNIPAPIVKSPPSVTAPSYTVGEVLTGTDGTWEGVGNTYTRQWQRSTDGTSWTDIVGATGATYRTDDPDIGSYLRLQVSAKNAEGTSIAASARPGTKVQQKESSLGGPTLPTPVPTVVPGSSAPAAPSTGSGQPGEPAAVAPKVPNGSGGNAATGRFVSSATSRSTTAKYGRVINLTGKIADAEGRAIEGAKVDVFEQVALPGMTRVKVSTVVTGADGSYSYRPATFSTRALEFAYAEVRGSEVYRDRLSVDLRVQSVVKFSVKNSERKRGRAVKFAGKVFAAPLPKRGVRVVIEAQDRTRWLTVKVLRTKQDGTFKWSHAFAAAGPYRLRARVIGSSDLPAKPSSSPFTSLRIR